MNPRPETDPQETDPEPRATSAVVVTAEAKHRSRSLQPTVLRRVGGVTLLDRTVKVLREAELVTVEVRGQQRIYRLDPAGLEAFDAWLGKVRRFWGRRLDILEQELAKPEPGEGESR